MSAIHYKTIKGIEYAYNVSSYWDKDSKKVKKKTEYVGRVIDKENGVYSRKKTKPEIKSSELILNFGATYCVYEHFKDSIYHSMFLEIFPQYFDTIMSLILFRLDRSSAMQYAQTWYEGNYAKILFKKADMQSQRISEFLKILGDESLQHQFFSVYLSKVYKNSSGVLIDSTGLPNEIDFPLNAWGHHGSTTEEQSRLLMVVDRSKNIPLYFRYMAGNIVDVSTLSQTIAELQQFGLNANFSIVDAGYYSEDNIKLLYENKISFLTRLPSNRKLYKNLIIQHSDTLECAENLVAYGKRVLFVKRVPVDLFGNIGCAYIVLDLKRYSDEATKYLLSAKEDGISFETVNEGLKFKGKLIFISSEAIEPSDIIPLYYTRQAVEDIFGITKNNLDILPLRVHSIETFRGYIMLNFLALVVFLNLRDALKNKYTIEDTILTMNNLMCKVYDGKLIVQEPSKKMKDIFKLLNMVVNFSGV